MIRKIPEAKMLRGFGLHLEHGLDFLAVNPQEEKGRCRSTGCFRNNKSKPDIVHLTGQAQQVSHRQQYQHLTAQRCNGRVHTVTQCLKTGADRNADGGNREAPADNPQGRAANVQEFRAGIENHQQRFREKLEHRQPQNHQCQTADAGEFQCPQNPLRLSCAVVVGNDGNGRVVDTEQRHKEEALQLEVDAEHTGCRLRKALQNLVHAKIHHRANAVHHHRGNAHCQDAAHRLLVQLGIAQVELYLRIILEVKENSHSSMKVEVWNQKDITANNLNLLNAVGKSSSHEPHFIHIKYIGAPESTKNIALVGKGITFDSGGSSLKPAASMTTMKTDMSGAALMFSLTTLAAELNLKININTYIPLAENIIGREALVPGDVITSASGKTVEILNTDAEGRLILADALYMATKTDPEIIIDAATLTGACTVALGPFCAGLFSNRKFLSKQITDISWESAEDVWELPLFDGYEQGINSTVADIQNMSTFGREGGAIHAALFLKQFVDNYPWIHLDIAGPAYLEKNHPIFGKEATGFGLRLLYQFIETHYLEADNAGY